MADGESAGQDAEQGGAGGTRDIVDRLIDPGASIERRLGRADAHDLRVARLTSVHALPPAPVRQNPTHQFKSETLRGMHFPAPMLNQPGIGPAPALLPGDGPRGGVDAGGVDWAEAEGRAVLDDVDEALDACLGSVSSAHFRSCGGDGGVPTGGTEAGAEGGTVPEGGTARSVGALSGGDGASGDGAGREPPPLWLEENMLVAEMASLGPALGGSPLSFGEPPPWLVKAAVRGCRTIDDVAARTSLEHHGPIDALTADAALLAEYNRWLLHASRRAEYLKERALEARREAAVAEDRERHAARGAALQQAAWAQRGLAQAERRNVARMKTLEARREKREAAARRADARLREARWAGHVAALHSEVADLPEEIKHARAVVTHNKRVGAQTLRAAAGAIERRKGELQQQREAEARAIRDRVRASSMVVVPGDVATAIHYHQQASATPRVKGARSFRVMSNPDSVLTREQPAALSRAGADGTLTRSRSGVLSRSSSPSPGGARSARPTVPSGGSGQREYAEGEAPALEC